MNWSVFKHFHGCGSPPTYDVISTRSLNAVAKGVSSENSALLMAAAPDLLAALQDAEIFMSGFEDDNLQQPIISKKLAAIRSAINKATGVRA